MSMLPPRVIVMTCAPRDSKLPTDSQTSSESFSGCRAKGHIDMRILKGRVFGISLLLGCRTRISDPYLYVVCPAPWMWELVSLLAFGPWLGRLVVFFHGSIREHTEDH